jgi:hypothetical protein
MLFSQCRLLLREESMRKFVFVLAAASAALVMPISLASAQTSRGMQDINTATQNFTPAQQAACQG